jgi:hypothetical protein
MSKEAMQMALHTLEGWANYGKWVWPESALEQAKRNTTESIAALRQALDTEQEPVAWRFRSGTWFNREVHWRYIDTLDGAEGLRGLQPLYTTPPKREWVGLTLNEAEDFYEKYTDRAELINAIDKFLEEKNA